MVTFKKDMIDEYDDRNTKICHTVRWNERDEYLLYLKQIGICWLSVRFPSQDFSLEVIRRVNQRFRSFGLEIYSAHNLAYRSLQIQLGKSGRNKYIEIDCDFIRCIGKLEILVSTHDFQPAGACTTDHIPHLIGDNELRTSCGRAGLSYSIAYIRSLLHRANKEVG
jgi:D-mannonate dehydratase